MIKFKLNGIEIVAEENETIWQAAKKNNIEIPHLCHADQVGYDPNGNCRACVVQVKGERTLAASCIRKPSEGMKVTTNDERSEKSRKMVLELLVTDQPERKTCHDPDSHFWKVASSVSVDDSRFDKRET